MLLFGHDEQRLYGTSVGSFPICTSPRLGRPEASTSESVVDPADAAAATTRLPGPGVSVAVPVRVGAIVPVDTRVVPVAVGVPVWAGVVIEVVGDGVFVGRGDPGTVVRVGTRVAVGVGCEPTHAPRGQVVVDMQQSASTTQEKNAKSVPIMQNLPVDTQFEPLH